MPVSMLYQLPGCNADGTLSPWDHPEAPAGNACHTHIASFVTLLSATAPSARDANALLSSSVILLSIFGHSETNTSSGIAHELSPPLLSVNSNVVRQQQSLHCSQIACIKGREAQNKHLAVVAAQLAVLSDSLCALVHF